MASTRRFMVMTGLWAALLVPTISLSMHDCHGFVGALAHSPVYGFIALSAALPALAMVAAARRS